MYDARGESRESRLRVPNCPCHATIVICSNLRRPQEGVCGPNPNVENRMQSAKRDDYDDLEPLQCGYGKSLMRATRKYDLEVQDEKENGTELLLMNEQVGTFMLSGCVDDPCDDPFGDNSNAKLRILSDFNTGSFHVREDSRNFDPEMKRPQPFQFRKATLFESCIPSDLCYEIVAESKSFLAGLNKYNKR